MLAARACKTSRQYPEKVRSESAAFGTLVAVSGRTASGPPLGLNLSRHGIGHSVSDAPTAGRNPRLPV